MFLVLLVLDALLPEPINSVRISHSHKGPGRLRKFGVILLDELSSDRVLESQVDNTANDVLKVAKQIVKRDEVEFCLNVGILGKLVMVRSNSQTC